MQYPSLGDTPVRTDILTPSFAAKNPYDAIALKALAKGSVEYTLAYDAVYNEPGSPWFKMFEEAVYNGNMNGGDIGRPVRHPEHAGQREELTAPARAVSPGCPGRGDTRGRLAAAGAAARRMRRDEDRWPPPWQPGRRRRRGPAAGARSSAQSRRNARTGLLLAAPALLFVAVFALYPLGFGAYISLTNWPLVGAYHFIGLVELHGA